MINRNLIFIFLLLYISYHLFTLSISPFPWFDEVCFASISNAFAHTGRFTFDVASYTAPFVYGSDEVFIYGPVYFFFTSMIIKTFGLGIFQFRITSLVFGFLVIFIFSKLLKFYKLNRKNILFVTIIFSLDPLLHSNMHGGRMDTMALFFALMSLIVILNSKNYSTPAVLYGHSLLSGVFAALAILTTPRSGFLLIPISVLLLYRWISEKNRERFFSGLLWASILLCLYLPWFFYAFGTFENLIAAYAAANKMIRVPFHIPIFQIPLVCIAFMSVLYGLYTQRRNYFSEINLISISSILLFYILVSDTGTYSVFIIPFYYLLIANSLSEENIGFQKKIKFSLMGSLLLINAVIFLFKSSIIFFDYNSRNPQNINDFVSKHIPKGSKVVGDDMYYYAVMQNGCDFQFIKWYSTDSLREKYHNEVYNYDYLIWSEILESKRPELFRLYSKNSNLKLIATYSSDSNSSSFLSWLNITHSYDCRIYKRLK